MVDTNILVSGFISPLSYPREIEKRWRNEQFALFTSPQIIDEIRRVLYLPRIKQKYSLSESDIRAFILAITYKASCTAGSLILSGVAPDPGDDKIISCAVEAQADFIVTGDKKFQQLEEYQKIRIMNAESFIKILDDEPGSV
ncbi:MAG: putative toxin-antitoxin system toxin component, PIN family [Chloroflexi bacterium]|nr:putative toxin-antitoxin system toxin component, PIN family [Chloroflexota bacterium]